jgi:hypothetical protein
MKRIFVIILIFASLGLFIACVNNYTNYSGISNITDLVIENFDSAYVYNGEVDSLDRQEHGELHKDCIHVNDDGYGHTCGHTHIGSEENAIAAYAIGDTPFKVEDDGTIVDKDGNPIDTELLIVNTANNGVGCEDGHTCIGQDCLDEYTFGLDNGDGCNKYRPTIFARLETNNGEMDSSYKPKITTNKCGNYLHIYANGTTYDEDCGTYNINVSAAFLKIKFSDRVILYKKDDSDDPYVESELYDWTTNNTDNLLCMVCTPTNSNDSAFDSGGESYQENQLIASIPFYVTPSDDNSDEDQVEIVEYLYINDVASISSNKWTENKLGLIIPNEYSQDEWDSKINSNGMLSVKAVEDKTTFYSRDMSDTLHWIGYFGYKCYAYITNTYEVETTSGSGSYIYTYYTDVEALNYTCDNDTLPGID